MEKSYKISKLSDNFFRVSSKADPSYRVDVYPMNGFEVDFKDAQPIFGVNWSACGTVSVAEALVYAKLIQAASKLALHLAVTKKENRDRLCN